MGPADDILGSVLSCAEMVEIAVAIPTKAGGSTPTVIMQNYQNMWAVKHTKNDTSSSNLSLHVNGVCYYLFK